MKILAVCGMGLGSSLLLRMQVEAALKELGIQGARVEVADVSTAKGMASDLIITSPQFEERLRGGVPVVAIKNYVDKQEIRIKLAEALNR